MDEMSSLSKKWRIAVKNNLFNGSFAEFAEKYNSTFSDDDFYSANAADSTGIKVNVPEKDTIKPIDLKPLDTTSPKKTKILGLERNTFFIVSGTIAVATAVGLYFFLKKINKKEGE